MLHSDISRSFSVVPNMDDSFKQDLFPKQLCHRSISLFLYPLAHEFGNNNTCHCLFLALLVVILELVVTQVEVTMFTLQVHKQPPSQHSHLSVNTQPEQNSELVEENGEGI